MLPDALVTYVPDRTSHRMKGLCVICDQRGRLTRDHVPPRGVVPAEPFLLTRLTDLAAPDKVPDRSPRRGFQAPTFPSLCETCNSKRLGAEYDPALAELAADLSTWVRAALQLGLRFQTGARTKARVGRVVRSVIGHLLAAEERRDPHVSPPRGSLQDSMREAFLNPALPWPSELRVYCWPYAGSGVVISRGSGLARVLGRTYGPIVGDVLKFFPLAFWVTQQPTEATGYRLVDLATYADADLDSIADVELPLRPIPSPFWPERPRDEEIIVMNSERSFVARRTRRRPPSN